MRVAGWRVTAVLSAALLGGAATVAAKTGCHGAADSSHCHNAEVDAMSQIGDLTYIRRSDGSSAVMHRIGDTSYISDSREGMSGVAQHVGDLLFIRLPLGDWVCSQVGASLLCS